MSQNAGFFARAGGTLIGAVILWDILFRGQLGFSISFLEEMWARNLGNLMMSPLTSGPRRAHPSDVACHGRRCRDCRASGGCAAVSLLIEVLGSALVTKPGRNARFM